jgi:beta-phosphoglucomutase family hydrolase
MTQPSAGVIFDMDGVLVDSKEAHYQAWKRLGEEIDVPCPRDVFERTFGMHNNQIIPIWLGDELQLAEVERLSRRKEEVFREVASGNVMPLEGVVDLVKSLHDNGFSLAVGSSGPLPNVELVLDLLGVRELFSALSTGDEVHHGKPHPEVFLIAARKLGISPERCVVIEDAPQGVEAARAAGAIAVAVTSTRPAADLQEADLVVPSLNDLTAAQLGELVDKNSV